MKLREWLEHIPEISPNQITLLDKALIESAAALQGQIPTDSLYLYISGRVQLLYSLMVNGIPEDLEAIYHGESEF